VLFRSDIPIARFVTPPLASVSAALAELGARAVERLLFALEHKNEHERRRDTLPTRLVPRASCAPPRVAQAVREVAAARA
jgi:DNA-binding LacI/PurR family transcriptional regulator